MSNDLFTRIYNRTATRAKNGHDPDADEYDSLTRQIVAEQRRQEMPTLGTTFGSLPSIPPTIQPSSREQELEAMVERLLAENRELKMQLAVKTTNDSLFQAASPSSDYSNFPRPSEAKGVCCQIFHNPHLTEAELKKHKTTWALKFEAQGDAREMVIGLYYPIRFRRRCKAALKNMSPAVRELLDIAIALKATTLFGVVRVHMSGGGTKWMNQAAIVTDFESDHPTVVAHFDGEEMQFPVFKSGAATKKASKWIANWPNKETTL